MRNIQIRIMRNEDIPSVAALEQAVFSEPWTEDGFAAALAQEGNCFVVAVAGIPAADADFPEENKSEAPGREPAECSHEKVIGYCGLYTAADEGEITNVAVAETYRRGGAGSALVGAVKKTAQQWGICRIFLEVRASNTAAQSLYKKEGFKTVGVRKDFYRKPAEDALVMCCNL